MLRQIPAFTSGWGEVSGNIALELCPEIGKQTRGNWENRVQGELRLVPRLRIPMAGQVLNGFLFQVRLGDGVEVPERSKP